MSAREQHPIEYLFNEQKRLPYCRYGVKPVPKMLTGTAFFPGGSGLWLGHSGSWYTPSDRPDMPEGKVMVLGHNFDSEKGYKETKSLEVQHELDSRTWRNLLPLLQAAGIDKKDCFFTNVYMGLKAGEKNTGEFPGARSEFKDRCQLFLTKQIAIQKPRLILTLGTEVPEFIAPLAPKLTEKAAWKKWQNFPKLDADEVSLVDDVRFDRAPEQSVTVVALLHPSERYRNAHLRSYCEQNGTDAELAMLKDALEQSGISNCG